MQRPLSPNLRPGLTGWKAADIERRWEAAKAGESGPVAPTPDARLRAAFAELGNQLRSVASHPYVTQPGLGALQADVLDVLAISRVISAELARRGDSATAPVPLGLVQETIDAVAARIGRMERLLSQLEGVAGEARELREAAEELLVKRRPAAEPFRRLAAHVLADVRDLTSAEEVLPAAAFDLDEWLAGAAGLTCPAAIVPALLTARIGGWMASHYSDWADRAERLVLAALLQDVSLLYLRRQVESSAGGGAELRRLHPRASACLAAGLGELSLDLPRLIALHHERIDGSGFPKGASGNALPPAARMLSVATRLVELHGQPDETDRPVFLGAATEMQSGCRLWREAKRGRTPRA